MKDKSQHGNINKQLFTSVCVYLTARWSRRGEAADFGEHPAESRLRRLSARRDLHQIQSSEDPSGEDHRSESELKM